MSIIASLKKLFGVGRKSTADEQAEERLKDALARFMGGTVKVHGDSATMYFETYNDAGTGLGGAYGGLTAGVIERGELFPRMLNGRDPLGMSEWYKIMYPS